MRENKVQWTPANARSSRTLISGDPECCGCLVPVTRGDQVDIVCNECAKILRTVSVDEIRPTFDQMEASLDVASEKCPHCGSVNLFPGFSRMTAFVCNECGSGVSVAE